MMDLQSFLHHKTLTNRLESCGLHVDYCDYCVFISCLDSHSDGTHSLLRIHWWSSDVMFDFSKSVLLKKLTHLHLGWPKGEYILIFGWAIPLRWNYKAFYVWRQKKLTLWTPLILLTITPKYFFWLVGIQNTHSPSVFYDLCLNILNQLEFVPAVTVQNRQNF